MPFDIGAPELIIILVIIMRLFGVGKLPEVGGAIGKGIREFRKASAADEGRAPAEPERPARVEDRAPQAVASGEWACAACGEVNPARNGFCGACGAARPAGSRPEPAVRERSEV